MRLSRYTMLEDVSADSYIAFNTFSKAMVVVAKDLLAIATGGGPIPAELVPAVDELKRQWIIVDDNADELALWNAWMGKFQYNNPVIELYLYLTMSCNLGCPYCFEGVNKPALHLTPETLMKTVAYIESLTEREVIQEVSIVFFGGEPMANRQMLVKAMEEFTRHLGHKVKLIYSLITNGTLFQSESEAQMLREKGLQFVQITLDGPKEIHDQRRMYLNGKGSYEVILRNLEMVVSHLNVSIRVNIDHHNKDYIKALIDELAARPALQGRLSFSFAWVYFDQRQEQDYHTLLLNQTEAAHICDDMINYAFEKGFSAKIGYDGPCMIHMMNGIVVYPTGDLYHCPNLAGHQKFSWGNVNTGIDETKKAYLPGLRTWEDCNDCELLPVCGGGCVAHRYNHTGQLGRFCEYKRLETSIRLDMRRHWRHLQEGRVTHDESLRTRC